MPTGPIRTALKVDLKKPAAEQPYLHVSKSKPLSIKALLISAAESMASGQYVSRVVTHWVQLTFEIVPFCGKVQNGEVVKIECVDWTG